MKKPAQAGFFLFGSLYSIRRRDARRSRKTKRAACAARSVFDRSVARSGLDRHQRDLDAAVLRAPGFGVVAGDRAGLAGADDDEALAIQATALQVAGDRIGALLGQLLVVGIAADAVGVAGDLDHGLVVLLQRARDVVEHGIELRLEVGLVEVEGDAAGHVQRDVVALADHVDAGAGGLLAQRRFLAVLVVADGGTGEAADARADECALAALGGVIAAEQAGGDTGQRTDEGALAGLAHALLLPLLRGLLLRVRLAVIAATAGRTAGQQRGGDDGSASGLEEILHVSILGRRVELNAAQANHVLVSGE